MTNRLARLAQAHFLLTGLAGLGVIGWMFATPSELQSQLLLGLSVSRLAMVGAFVIVAAVATVLAWYSRRRPEKVADWIRRHLSRDGWLRLLVFFASASAFLVGLALVGFRDWLPVPPGVILRLQPAVVWVMIVAALNLLCVFGLHDADEPWPPSQPIQTESPDPAAKFLRDFFIGCMVLLLSTCALFLVNLLIGVLVRDHMNAAMVTLMRASLSTYDFKPEQIERARYIATALLFPILAFITWTIANRLQWGVPRSTAAVGTITLLVVTGGLASWVFLSLREVDFLYLRIPYPNLQLAPAIAVFLAIVGLLLVERRYLSGVWRKRLKAAGSITLGLLVGLAVVSRSLLSSADEYVYTVHFNAYFHSVVQVFLGRTLLVDLSNQYGFYPYFLEPFLHLVGLGIPQLTLVMGALHVAFLAIVFYLLTRVVKSRIIALCGFVAIANVWLSTQYGALPDPYFQYWPHRLIFPAIVLLLAFLHQAGHGKRKRAAYALGFLACGAGLLWNFDTGAIAFAVWTLYLCWETLLGWRTLGLRGAVLGVASHLASAVATLLTALGLLLLYTYLRSGSVPDLGKLGFYQSLFYQSGYGMLPMPLFHPWNLVVLTYMAGLCVCAAFLVRRLRGGELPEAPDQKSWVTLVFVVSVMGVGLFTNYQGRSHDLNLLGTLWSAFFLLALFSDALTDRLLQEVTVTDLKMDTLRSGAMLTLPALLLLVLSVYVGPFFGKVPSSILGLQAQVQEIQLSSRGVPHAYTRRLELMRRYFRPGEEAPIFSPNHDTAFYIETRATNPVRAPGWYELFLESDVRQYAHYLERDTPRMFLVSDEFASAFPELYALIQNYVEVEREKDLALYMRKDPAK